MHYYNLFVHFYFVKTVHSYFIIFTLNRYVCVSACEYNVKYADISHYGFSMAKEELENMKEEIYIY